MEESTESIYGFEPPYYFSWSLIGGDWIASNSTQNGVPGKNEYGDYYGIIDWISGEGANIAVPNSVHSFKISNGANNVNISGNADYGLIHNYGHYTKINVSCLSLGLSNYGDDCEIISDSSNSMITNQGINVYIKTGNGLDWIENENSGMNTRINSGAGDDTIDSRRNNVLISSGEGNDVIINAHIFGWGFETKASNVTINSGTGNDSIVNGLIDRIGGSHALIIGGSGNDSISNDFGGNYSTINGDTGDDLISNGGADVNIDAGIGNDSIYNMVIT